MAAQSWYRKLVTELAEHVKGLDPAERFVVLMIIIGIAGLVLQKSDVAAACVAVMVLGGIAIRLLVKPRKQD